MTIEEALVTYLKTKTALTVLISTKIYPLALPQSTILPAVIYQKISSYKPRGAVNGHYGLNVDVIELRIYSNTYSNLKLITEQLNTILMNYQGMMGTVEVQGCFNISESYETQLDKTQSGDATMIVQGTLEYQIIY